MNGPAPPGNANAPVAKGRRYKLTGEIEYSACPHSATVTEQMPRGHLHHAEVRCANCGAHLRRLPKPSNVERRRFNGFRLVKLSMVEGLSSWERGFLASVSKLRKLSPRQQMVLGRICRQFFGGPAT